MSSVVLKLSSEAEKVHAAQQQFCQSLTMTGEATNKKGSELNFSDIKVNNMASVSYTA